MADEMKTFQEFWPYYVKAHSKKGTRRLHFVGTTSAMAIAAAGLLLRRPSLLLLSPVVGYGFAWFGHFFIEGNKPATFGHPLWSLQADFIMWKKILDGTMDAEVERVMNPVKTPAPDQQPDQQADQQTDPQAPEPVVVAATAAN